MHASISYCSGANLVSNGLPAIEVVHCSLVSSLRTLGADRPPVCMSCRDELRAAWAAFTPLLHAIDAGKLSPEPYPAGSRGPPASDVLVSKAGFVKNKDYIWKEGVDSLETPQPRM